MDGNTFSGYVEGLQLTKLGKAISLKIKLITPGGKRIELFIHNPPDWLKIGKAISGTYNIVETNYGTKFIVDNIVENTDLRPAMINELLVEKILGIGESTVVVEGRYQDGRFFSHTLRDIKLLEFIHKLPMQFLGLFIEKDSLQVLITILTKNEFAIVSRASELSSLLSKISSEEPEKKFLNGE